VKCSTRPPSFSTDRRKVRHLAKLSWFLSVAESPWSWPIFALVTVAVVGQWAGVSFAEAVVAGFGAIGIGIAVGLAPGSSTTAGGPPMTADRLPMKDGPSLNLPTGWLQLSETVAHIPHERRTCEEPGWLTRCS